MQGQCSSSEPHRVLNEIVSIPRSNVEWRVESRLEYITGNLFFYVHDHLSYSQKVLFVIIVGVLLAAWTHVVVRVQPPGGLRFYAAFPVFVICGALPAVFDYPGDVCTKAIAAFLLPWVTAFKVMGFCLNRGPLCSGVHLSFPQFAAVFLLPINPLQAKGAGADAEVSDAVKGADIKSSSNDAQGDDADAIAGSEKGSHTTTPGVGVGGAAAGRNDVDVNGIASMAANGAVTPATCVAVAGGGAVAGGTVGDVNGIASIAVNGKVGARGRAGGRADEESGSLASHVMKFYGKSLLLWFVVWMLGNTVAPPWGRTLLQAFGLYGLLGIVMDGPCALLLALMGLRLSPHFDKPYLAHSVANFWGQRWNLVAGNMLRAIVYEPILEGRLVKVGDAPAVHKAPLWRRLLGLHATFAVSGLAHEMIWKYLTYQTTGGVWFTYFAIQAPIIAAEMSVYALLRRLGVRSLPRAFTWFPTMAILLYVGHHLFIPPPEESGVAARVVDSIAANYQLLADVLTQLYARKMTP